ncbi:hypothetical protein KAT80_01835 [Candidatus Pacearchaeota archaeon]|nr:hypothetical protein [Candidatus Pacearchaeota archaeon]
MREDILGALKSALIRGETLKKAMMTLYNAGYKKNQIEESAAALQQIIQQQKPVAQAKPSQSIQQPKRIQKVSDYGQTSTKLQQTPIAQVKPLQPIQEFVQPSFQPIQQPVQSKIKIILIIFSLIILIGILVGSLLFSSELIEILNSVFN